MPPDPPSLPHVLHMIHTCPPPRNPYNLILSPLGQKAERNPGGCHPLNRTVYHCIAQVEKNALAEEAKCHTQSPWEKTEREAGEGAHRKGLAQLVKLVTIIMLSYHTRTSDSKEGGKNPIACSYGMITNHDNGNYHCNYVIHNLMIQLFTVDQSF